MADTDELARRLQGLPAEIFNHIFALTIAVDDNVVIDYTYKPYMPPIGLQLSRKTRESFACDYYGNTEFSANITNGQGRVQKWLAALPVAHINLLRTIKMDDVSDGLATDFPIVTS